MTSEKNKERTSFISKALDVLSNLFKPKEPEKQNDQLVTRLDCTGCDIKKTRLFKVGDYIYKDEGPCGTCDGKMIITGIYTQKNKINN